MIAITATGASYTVACEECGASWTRSTVDAARVAAISHAVVSHSGATHVTEQR
jgi:hypothetical protein